MTDRKLAAKAEALGISPAEYRASSRERFDDWVKCGDEFSPVDIHDDGTADILVGLCFVTSIEDIQARANRIFEVDDLWSPDPKPRLLWSRASAAHINAVDLHAGSTPVSPRAQETSSSLAADLADARAQIVALQNKIAEQENSHVD